MAGSKSREVRNAELNEIKRLLGDFNSDKAIMDHLNLEERTFYRYKKRIYKEEDKTLKKTREDSLSHDLMQVRRSLEYVQEQCMLIVEDEKTENKDRIAALELLSRAAYAKVDASYGPTKALPVVSRINDDVKKLTVKQ